jgi:hypothetical protein
MTKPEAEKAIRRLCTEWARELSSEDLEHPSFDAFRTWLDAKGYGHYLTFRSVAGPLYDAEMWFDDELGQSWRR